LDVGETIVQGVHRELEEETGIEVHVIDHIETFERIVKDDSGRVQYHYVILDYLCEAVGGDLRAGGDATDVAWVTENELATYLLREAATRVIKKAFGMIRARLRE
jgi:ADP-ribose pyrophosphatase YjhB (NUDIX family)